MLTETQLEGCFARILKANPGGTLIASRRITGGGNNQVYKLTTSDGKTFLGKYYFNPGKHQRCRRLTAEYDALQFLDGHDVRNVPKPIGLDYDTRIGIYDYIQGEPPDLNPITTDELSQAAGFLSELHRLRKSPQAGQLNRASDACLAMADYQNSVDLRLQKILTAISGVPIYDTVSAFLRECFLPTAKAVSSSFNRRIDPDGSANGWQAILPTLSPSDFGFHNCLRTQSGELCFFDFEYFGWDDPAKMVADFFHHPAMNLNDGQCRYFLDTFIANSGLDNGLRKRIKAVYPLVGLKWCLLMLNICMPEIMARKQFADVGIEPRRLIERQLVKAEAKLAGIRQYMNDA